MALEISRGDQALMYRRQQSERQKVVQLCTAAFDEDGDVQKFLLSLNDSKKNIECCSMQMADNDLIIALDGKAWNAMVALRMLLHFSNMFPY